MFSQTAASNDQDIGRRTDILINASCIDESKSARLLKLFNLSRWERVHGRFVCPVMMIDGEYICRSSTLSIQAEAIFNSFVSKTSNIFTNIFGSNKTSIKSGYDSLTSSPTIVPNSQSTNVEHDFALPVAHAITETPNNSNIVTSLSHSLSALLALSPFSSVTDSLSPLSSSSSPSSNRIESSADIANNCDEINVRQYAPMLGTNGNSSECTRDIDGLCKNECKSTLSTAHFQPNNCNNSIIINGKRSRGKCAVVEDLTLRDSSPLLGQADRRATDIAIMNELGTVHVVDLMVEKCGKYKLGMCLTSSEKAETDKYGSFRLNSLPYPGCEFFTEYNKQKHNGESIIFDWHQNFVDATLKCDAAIDKESRKAGHAAYSTFQSSDTCSTSRFMASYDENTDASQDINRDDSADYTTTDAWSSVNWTEYRSWSLVTLTQNYFLLCLKSIRKNKQPCTRLSSVGSNDVQNNNGVLIHCISGWDRTPLFVSLLRISLWADGCMHKSLSPAQILYLTLSYDWFLFGHDLSNRLTKKEDILYFCFDFLQYICEDKFRLNLIPSSSVSAPLSSSTTTSASSATTTSMSFSSSGGSFSSTSFASVSSVASSTCSTCSQTQSKEIDVEINIDVAHKTASYIVDNNTSNHTFVTDDESVQRRLDDFSQIANKNNQSSVVTNVYKDSQQVFLQMNKDSEKDNSLLSTPEQVTLPLNLNSAIASAAAAAVDAIPELARFDGRTSENSVAESPYIMSMAECFPFQQDFTLETAVETEKSQAIASVVSADQLERNDVVSHGEQHAFNFKSEGDSESQSIWRVSDVLKGISKSGKISTPRSSVIVSISADYQADALHEPTFPGYFHIDSPHCFRANSKPNEAFSNNIDEEKQDLKSHSRQSTQFSKRERLLLNVRALFFQMYKKIVDPNSKDCDTSHLHLDPKLLEDICIPNDSSILSPLKIPSCAHRNCCLEADTIALDCKEQQTEISSPRSMHNSVAAATEWIAGWFQTAK
jgi:hypothetical protein